MEVDDDGVLFGKEGNTTTAFGTQEWLIKAVTGEIETPMLDKSVGQESANEFETNWAGRIFHQHEPVVERRVCACAGLTREQRSMTTAPSGQDWASVSWPT